LGISEKEEQKEKEIKIHKMFFYQEKKHSKRLKGGKQNEKKN